MCQLLQNYTKFELTQFHKNTIFDKKENLAQASKFSVLLLLTNKQLVINCNTSKHAAVHVLLTEDYTNENKTSSRACTPAAHSSRRLTAGQLSLTTYAKKFIAIHFAFDEFGHVFWGVKSPIIVMTDSKARTRFLQTKEIVEFL